MYSVHLWIFSNTCLFIMYLPTYQWTPNILLIYPWQKSTVTKSRICFLTTFPINNRLQNITCAPDMGSEWVFMADAKHSHPQLFKKCNNEQPPTSHNLYGSKSSQLQYIILFIMFVLWDPISVYKPSPQGIIVSYWYNQKTAINISHCL